jgi:hypothetical protein
MEEVQVEETSSVVLALRLGWSMSEFMGWARRAWARHQTRQGRRRQQQPPKELRGFADDEAPRLTYSNRYFSPEGAWWQAALRIVSLAEQLAVMDEDDETAVEIRALPDRVYALTYGEGDESEGRRHSPRDFYDLLEPWGREVGIKLAGRSDQAALAFRIGGQLADTYWFMRDEGHFGAPRDGHKQDSWHQLLNYKRLNRIIEDLKLVEDELPPWVDECLRFSIYRWMIAHDLEYRGDDLVLVRSKHRKDSGMERERESSLKQIRREDEKRIVERLEQQVQIWQALILGQRDPESYLNRSRRRWALWRAVLHYLLVTIGATFVLSLVGYGLVVVLGGVVSTVFTWVLETLPPTEAQPDTLKTSLEVVAGVLPLVTGAIVFVASSIRDGWTEARGLWHRVHEAARGEEIKRSTWVPVGLSNLMYRLRYWRRTE